MTPTIVFKDGRPFLATGSLKPNYYDCSADCPNVIDHNMNIGATAAPRFHQWRPDYLRLELVQRGYPRNP